MIFSQKPVATKHAFYKAFCTYFGENLFNVVIIAYNFQKIKKN